VRTSSTVRYDTIYPEAKRNEPPIHKKLKHPQKTISDSFGENAIVLAEAPEERKRCQNIRSKHDSEPLSSDGKQMCSSYSGPHEDDREKNQQRKLRCRHLSSIVAVLPMPNVVAADLLPG
jgi:hypothetical protein